MQCKKCGGELEGNALFCRFCGNRIESPAPISVEENSDNEYQSDLGFEPKKYDYPVITPDQTDYEMPDENKGDISFDMGGVAADYEVSSYDDSPAQSSDENEGKTKSSKIVFIIVALAIVIAAAVAAIVMIDNNSNNDDYYPEEIYGEQYYEQTYDYFIETDTTTEPEFTTNYYVETTAEKLVIASGGLRMRDKPNIEVGERISVIPNGTVITIERIADGWAYTTYEGISGWCSCDYLFEPSEYEGVPLYHAKVNEYEGMNLYADASINNYNVLTTVPFKATVSVYRAAGEWSYVEYGNVIGWCLSESLDEVI